MKVYRNYTKAIVTAVFFLGFCSVSSILLPEGYFIAVPLGFLFTGGVLFEIQKSTLARSLKQTIIGRENASAFIYDNGLKHDFFENFLLLSENKIVSTTCYLPVQKYFNAWIGKPSYLRVYEPGRTKISVNPYAKTLSLEAGEYRETLQILHFDELLRQLNRFNINVTQVLAPAGRQG